MHNRSESSNSSVRVQSWLDSMYYHHSSFDDEMADRSDEKSSLSSNISGRTTNTKLSTRNSTKSKSRKSLSTSSSSSYTNQNCRRIYLRRPRYLIRRFNKKSNLRKNTSENEDQTSYLSNNTSSADESTLFSSTTFNGLKFLNDESKKQPDIRADDLEFESRNSFTSSSSSYCSNFSANNHVFGILDVDSFENSLHLTDDLVFKVKTYAFNPKDIKMKVKGDLLIVTGKQQIEEDDAVFKREFRKKFDLPTNADKKNIKYDFDNNDCLTITVPRIHSINPH